MSDSTTELLKLTHLPVVDSCDASVGDYLHIDLINGMPAEDKATTIGSREGAQIYGWAIDPGAHALPSRLFVQIDDTDNFIAPEAISLRDDVAKAFGNAQYRYSGFFVNVPWSLLPEGNHTLTFFTICADGKYQFPLLQRQIYVDSKEKLVPHRGGVINIDSINNTPVDGIGGVTVRHRENLVIQGWAVNPYTKGALSKLVVRLDNQPELFVPNNWFYREDVLHANEHLEHGNYGFCVSIPWHYLKKGEHTITVTAIGADSLEQLEQIEVQLIVGEQDIRFASRLQEAWDYEREAAWLSDIVPLPKGEEPLVSIIMPAKDREILIERAIASVLSQDYQNWELIVIDDGSSDNTAKVVSGYVSKDSRINFTTNKGTGVSAARNTGLELASGQYIAFLDTDNEWQPYFLTTMIASMQQNRLEAAYCAVEMLDDAYESTLWAEKLYLAFEGSMESLLIENHIDINCLVCNYEKSLNNVRFDESLQKLEDWDYVINVSKLCSLALLPFIGVVYHTDADKRVTTTRSDNWFNVIKNKHWIDWSSSTCETDSRVSVILFESESVECQRTNFNNILIDAVKSNIEIEFLVLCVSEDIYTKKVLQAEAIDGVTIRYLNIPAVAGRAVCLNYAIAKALGEYILLITEDVILDSGALNKFIMELNADNVLGVQALIVNNNSVLSAGIDFIGNGRFPVASSLYYPIDHVRNVLFDNYDAISTSVSFFRRSALSNSAGFDPLLSQGWEDVDLCLRLKRKYGGKYKVSRDITAQVLNAGFSVALDYQSESQEFFIERWSNEIRDEAGFADSQKSTVKAVGSALQIRDLSIFKKTKLSNNSLAQDEFDFDNYVIDIIIPIYNGYEYLEKLFQTVVKTRMSIRVLAIDDCSPDSRIIPFLNKAAKDDNRIHVLKNEKNLGFVQTVNKGLGLSINHVVLLNTDVELPNGWLERLMAPIIQNPNVASATPFSNAATIFSYPVMCVDNLIPTGQNVDTIDNEFQKLIPAYNEVPTGVGFCMGMSRDAIRAVGVLNAELFGRGYGEENDWCQRAILGGFINVQVENLFVYHKHGGSFEDEKVALIEDHLKIINSLYPDYSASVQDFIISDPARLYREWVSARLFCQDASLLDLYFGHDGSGGAVTYLNKRIAESHERDHKTITVVYDTKRREYCFKLSSKFSSASFASSNFDDVLDFILQVDTIVINELVGYLNLEEIVEKIICISAAHDAPIEYLLHDFYCLCPRYDLLNNKNVFCKLPEVSKCALCINSKDNVRYNYTMAIENIETWRNIWQHLFQHCKTIVVFSKSSQELFTSIFGLDFNAVAKLELRPHTFKPLKKIQKPLHKADGSITVGVLGAIGLNKGSRVIEELAAIANATSAGLQIVLIGYADIDLEKFGVKVKGAYNKSNISQLVIDSDIDVLLIPSIWPETFSFTTVEAISLGLPVAVFDLGAQAEHVKKYSKGIIIPNITAASALESILDAFATYKSESPETGCAHAE